VQCPAPTTDERDSSVGDSAAMWALIDSFFSISYVAK
jgi:hypothetical protein